MRGHNYSRADHDELAPAVELVRPSRDWWHDRLEIATLAAWLVESGQEPKDWPYFIEKPWKWSPEREDMLREEATEHAYEEERSELERRYQP